MIRPLPTRQLQALAFIRSFRKQVGYAPSVRELARYLEVAPATAHEILLRLVAKGLVIRDGNRARSWQPTPAGIEVLAAARPPQT